LALDSGMRLAELAGLKWQDVDLEHRKVAVVRQLAESKLADDGSVQFGPTKTGRPRVIEINDETVRLFRAHRKAQSELKMRNRTTYRDDDLVFAKEQLVPWKRITLYKYPDRDLVRIWPRSDVPKLRWL
jgi:integrase